MCIAGYCLKYSFNRSNYRVVIRTNVCTRICFCLFNTVSKSSVYHCVVDLVPCCAIRTNPCVFPSVWLCKPCIYTGCIYLYTGPKLEACFIIEAQMNTQDTTPSCRDDCSQTIIYKTIFDEIEKHKRPETVGLLVLGKS